MHRHTHIHTLMQVHIMNTHTYSFILSFTHPHTRIHTHTNIILIIHTFICYITIHHIQQKLIVLFEKHSTNRNQSTSNVQANQIIMITGRLSSDSQSDMQTDSQSVRQTDLQLVTLSNTTSHCVIRHDSIYRYKFST